MPAIDPTFGTNNFKEPEFLSESQTYVNNILMILFGKPGFYPSIPTLGMDVQRYLYQFIDDINTQDIKRELQYQCSEFIPEVQNGDFNVFKSLYNGNPILIFQLPLIDDTNENSISLGISFNHRGEFVYKFIEGKHQIL